MFALIAAIILFLVALGVISSTEDVDWFLVGLAAWALHFAIAWGIPVPAPWRVRERSDR